MMNASGNPVLDELDNLSPHAKTALQLAHSQIVSTPRNGMPAVGAPAPGPQLLPTIQPAATQQPGKLAMLSPSGQSQSTEQPAVTVPGMLPTIGQPPPQPAAPGTIPTIGRTSQSPSSPGMLPTLQHPSLSPRMQSLEDTSAELSKGSGISQIKNPWLRGLGIAGDAVASGLFPHIASVIPGTEAHHALLVNRNQGAIKSEEGLESEQTKNAELGAQAGMYQARADALRNPPGSIKEEQLLYDKNGAPIGYRDEHGKYYGPDDPNLPPGVHDVIAASGPSSPRPVTTHCQMAK